MKNSVLFIEIIKLQMKRLKRVVITSSLENGNKNIMVTNRLKGSITYQANRNISQMIVSIWDGDDRQTRNWAAFGMSFHEMLYMSTKTGN